MFLGPRSCRARAGARLARVSRSARRWPAPIPLAVDRSLVLARARSLHAHRADDGDSGRADEVLSGAHQFRPVAVDLQQVEHRGAAVGSRVLPPDVHARLSHAAAARRFRWCGDRGRDWRGWGRAPIFAWLVSQIVFFFIAGEVQRVHEYYQLPFLVIGAIYFGAVAGRCSTESGCERPVTARGGIAAVAAALTVVALRQASTRAASRRAILLRARRQMPTSGARSTRSRRTTAGHSRGRLRHHVADPWTSRTSKAGASIRGHLSSPVVDTLRRLGAKYFVSTQWSHVRGAEAGDRELPRAVPDLPLADAPADTRGIDLRQRRR